MAVIIWNRIEPDPRGQSVDEGARATIYDPLWHLARQWQLGELTGSNGGSPISVDVTSHSNAIAELRRGDQTTPFVVDGPLLESLVEREPAPQADLRLRGRGGRLFQDLLRAADFERYVATVGEEYAFLPSQTETPLLTRLRGRAPDGDRIRAALAEATLAETLNVTQDDRERFDAVAARWLAWYAPRAGEPGEETWQPDRMEYAFELRLPSEAGTVVLEAPEYRGGRLDWDAFRARIEPGAASEPVESLQSVLPSVVDFPGAGTRRFWQRDRSQFERISAGPGEVGRLLLVEYALLWAHDWFVVPLPVSAGALVRIASLVVTDTFGARTAIVPAHTALPSDKFNLFRLGAVDGADLAGVLFIPPVLPAAVESAPIEEVAVVRDEGANVAWAIERVVPDDSGRPIRSRRHPEAPASTLANAGEEVTYVPITPVEQGWFPLVPRRDAGGARRLERAELVTDTSPTPRGAVLGGTFSVLDDEVPREGLVVRRRWQLARAFDGTLCLWITREREPSAGEVATGFAFDRIDGT